MNLRKSDHTDLKLAPDRRLRRDCKRINIVFGSPEDGITFHMLNLAAPHTSGTHVAGR